MSSATSGFVMRLSCPDRVGVVSSVSTVLATHCANILEAHHFRDALASRSVMRLVFEQGSGRGLDLAQINAQFSELAERLQMSWVIHDLARRPRVLIAVSNFGHCLNSLLHRWSVGTLPIDIVGVVSNHDSQRRMVEGHGLPFFHYPIESGRKEAQEARMLALFDDSKAELLVLARYMQILTAQACRHLAGRAINIHHSFLPGFKGARPYTQAYERGVKLIGATAHYVNEALDEGPIIEQAVERVDHSMTPDQLTTIGNEIESVVLNRAVQWHAEHRVFEFGNRTVVLR
jgi:formyltetrahydrofolate deformylase